MLNFALQSRDKRSLVAVQSFFCATCSLARALKHSRLGIAQSSLALLSARRSLAYALKHPRLGIAQASLALLSARRSLTDWNIIDNNCFGVLVG